MYTASHPIYEQLTFDLFALNCKATNPSPHPALTTAQINRAAFRDRVAGLTPEQAQAECEALVAAGDVEALDERDNRCEHLKAIGARAPRELMARAMDMSLDEYDRFDTATMLKFFALMGGELGTINCDGELVSQADYRGEFIELFRECLLGRQADGRTVGRARVTA